MATIHTFQHEIPCTGHDLGGAKISLQNCSLIDRESLISGSLVSQGSESQRESTVTKRVSLL